MNLKKWMNRIIYILLVFMCACVVGIVFHLEKGKLGRKQTSAESTAQEKSAEITAPVKDLPGMENPSEIQDATPSNAIPMTDEERLKLLEQYKEQIGFGSRRKKNNTVKTKQDKINEMDETCDTEQPYVPPTIMLASDLHYCSKEMQDGGAAFRQMLMGDDGKVTQYSDEIVDALLEQTLRTKPSALILSGDITLNGEVRNHELLAEKLRKVQETGVRVLVVPGNHDIGYYASARYVGAETVSIPAATAEDFYQIYHEFGYDQATSRDEHSLSYVYQLDESHWMLMLDTAWYEPYNHVNGRLKEETLDWVRVQLELAKEKGAMVIPVGHHNLLSESRLYTTECTMENAPEVRDLFGEYELPLYFSGHLHAQRVKRYRSEPGEGDDEKNITEIVLSPYAIAPCEYGILTWNQNDAMSFDTLTVDVAGWSREHELENAELTDFESFGPLFAMQVKMEQIMPQLESLPEEMKQTMARTYADVYVKYVNGDSIDPDFVRRQDGYHLWEKYFPDSIWVKEIRNMIEDAKNSARQWGKNEED